MNSSRAIFIRARKQKMRDFSTQAGLYTRRAARYAADHPVATLATASRLLVRSALYFGGCERHEIDLAAVSVLFAKVTLRQSLAKLITNNHV